MRFRLHIALIIGAVTVIYLPIAGHQLHTDDFTRISDNSSLNVSYFQNILFDNKTDGFYRPLNHLSFGITYWLFGLNPYAYGYFNYLLLVATCLAVFCIIRRCTGDEGLATLLVVAWLANVKVVASTILWAVGRTSGLEMLFASCAILMVIKTVQSGRWPPLAYALIFAALALLSKESALILGPLLLAMAAFGLSRARSFHPRHFLVLGSGLLAIYILYFILRHTSGAMTPNAAPDYYRWRLAPLALLRNLASYGERSLQFSVVLVPLLWIAMPRGRGLRPPFQSRAKWAALFLALFAFTISPALPVPFRSNLYPYLPSIFLVGALAATLGYHHKLPQFGLSRKRFLMSVSLLVMMAAPIAWRRGQEAYRRHGHTLSWAKAIEHACVRGDARTVCIWNDPARDEATLDPLELHFLREALKLKRVDVDVHVVERDCCPSLDPACRWVRLERTDRRFLAGDLTPVEAAAEPANP
jgi:hypothetical protein